MKRLETGQTVEVFRYVNTAKLAEATGGASRVTDEEAIALWRDGGVNVTVHDGVTDWSWRGIFQAAGHIIPDSAVLADPSKDEIKVVLPAGEHDPVQGFTIRKGRIKGFESYPTSTDPLRQAAVYARDVFIQRQEATSQPK